MTTYQIVLFVHLLSLLLATGAAAVIHFAHFSMRRATTLGEAGRWGLAMKHTAHTVPFAVVGLLGSGAYMVSDVWNWSLPWVVAALCGLAAIVLVGDVVNGRNGKELGQAIGRTIGASGDGPVTDEVMRLLERPSAIAAIFFPTLMMIGVVFVMTAKPNATDCAIALLVCSALAVATGPLLARRPAEMAAAVATPAEAEA